MRITPFTLSFCLLAACGGPSSTPPDSQKDPSGNIVLKTEESVPMFRDSLKKEPVAEYRQRIEDPLNEWYFSVRLYETKKTFQYTMKLEYEEINGLDTLKLPNFGAMPEPMIRKGPDKYSCIVGFLDKEKQFREYKKIYVMNNTLKVTALRHYAVATYTQ